MKYFDILINFLADATGISATIIRPFLGTIILIIVAKTFKIFFAGMVRDFSKDKNKVYERTHNINLIIDSLTAFLIILFLGRYIDNLATFMSLSVSALTLALRDVIINFFFGIYNRKHKTFKVGDRIEIDGVKGDVVNIGRLSFDILEVQNEEYGQSTGCIITMPNNFMNSKHLRNFNKGFKYVWTELKINIPRDADVEKTKKVLYDVVNTVDAIKKVPKHIEKALVDIQTNYKILYNDYKPIIYTRIFNRYYEFDIRYLIDVKQIRNVEDEILLKLIEEDKKGHIKLYKEG
jgi:small-conductance mechanosensitive channel